MLFAQVPEVGSRVILKDILNMRAFLPGAFIVFLSDVVPESESKAIRPKNTRPPAAMAPIAAEAAATF